MKRFAQLVLTLAITASALMMFANQANAYVTGGGVAVPVETYPATPYYPGYVGGVYGGHGWHGGGWHGGHGGWQGGHGGWHGGHGHHHR